MQRVTRLKDFNGPGMGGISGQGFLVSPPEFPVCIDHRRNPGLINGFEQAAAEHLNRLVFLGRVQERRLAR